jgi:DNA-binding response OmpR family regulator
LGAIFSITTWEEYTQLAVCALLAIQDESAKEDIQGILKLGFPDSEIILADSGQACMESVQIRDPQLIVADINLPGASGLNLVKKLRSLTDASIIILSYTNDQTQIIKTLEAGADEYLIKPIKQLEFLARVRSQLRKRVSI